MFRWRNMDIKIVVIAKVLQVILFKLALTEGMRYLYYVHQRRISFVLFIIIALIAGRQNKYFSCLLAIIGILIFNPFYKAQISGETWDILEWSLICILIFWIFLDLYSFIIAPKKGIGILKAIKWNKKVQKYEITDSSVIYEFEPSLYKNLKKYMRKSNIGSMHTWYKTLEAEEKNRVSRKAKHDEALED